MSFLVIAFLFALDLVLINSSCRSLQLSNEGQSVEGYLWAFQMVCLGWDITQVVRQNQSHTVISDMRSAWKSWGELSVSRVRHWRPMTIFILNMVAYSISRVCSRKVRYNPASRSLSWKESWYVPSLKWGESQYVVDSLPLSFINWLIPSWSLSNLSI